MAEDYAGRLACWAQRQPERVFLVSGNTSLTYGEMEVKVESYAEKFRAAGPRQTVLVIKKDSLEQAEAFLGAERAGWVPVLGHPDLSREAAEELCRVRQIGWIDRGEKLESLGIDAPVPGKNICMGVLSSGSSGLPKLMFRTFASWGDFFPEQNKMFQVGRDAVAFGEGSLSFTGNSNLWASVLFAGASMVFGQGLHPRSWLKDIKKYKVTVLYLVPVKLKLLLQTSHEACPLVRTVLAGSQLLEAGTAGKLKQLFPNSRIILYYGASEVDYITWLTYDELLRHPGSVGRPCPGVKVFVRDGLIYIDTPYHVENLPRPCTLKDRGYFDDDGYLIFLGRAGQVINKGGLTISCTRVEQALQAVDGVLDAAVVPIKDTERGEDMGACVVLSPKASLKKIRQDLKKTLLPAEIPGRWKQVDALPLNGVGKVDARQIEEMFRS